MQLAIVALISYVLGSIPFSVIVTSLYRKNLREAGTGNPGTANVYRTTGRIEAALLTLVGDMGKGAVSMIIAQRADSDLHAALAIAAFFVIAGHNWPVFLGFRGGRGLACLGGVMLVLNWKDLLLSLIILVLSILLAEFLTKQKVGGREGKSSLLSTLTSQVAGRMLGIGLSLMYLNIFNPSMLQIISGGLALVVIKHIGRIQKFIR